MRILAVDDEQSILELLTEALPVMGFDHVQTASSAQEALDLLSREDNRFDCFLLDIQMPFIDGIDLCERIRAMARYRDTPIIMLTAMSEKSYVDAAFQKGATDYLTKPFDMLELSTRLKLAAHRHVAEEQTLANAKTAIPLIQSDKSDPDALDGIERVISLTAFENYVLQLTRARLMTAGLFAIKIPELAKPPKGMSDNDERQWRTQIARAISQATHYDQSIISHAGKGVFLVLNKSWGTNRKETLHNAILDIYGELDTDLPAGKRPKPTIIVGGVVSLPAFGRSFTLSYLQKAIQRAEAQCETKPEKKEHWLKRRTNAKSQDTQAREYKKILSEFIGEIDPLDVSEQGKRIVARKVAALPTPRQLRTAV